MLKFITIAMFIGVVAAAPSGLILSRFGSLESPASTIHATHVAPLAYVRAPLSYAEPATLTKYNSISSPLTYTATHEPAVAITNLAPLAYSSYPANYAIRYAAPLEQAPFGFAY